MSSLRVRLVLATSLVLALSLYLTVEALDRAFHRSALNAQEEKMKGLIYSVLGAIDVKPDGSLHVDEFALQDARLLASGSGLQAAIFGENGTLLWKSPSTPKIDPLETV